MCLARQIYRGGYEKQEIPELFRFIDWVVALPKGLQKRFEDGMERFEAEKGMRYMTKWERQGLEKGLEQGIVQGEATLLERQLRRRFEGLPAWVEERLANAGREELESWADRVFEAKALEDVFA